MYYTKVKFGVRHQWCLTPNFRGSAAVEMIFILLIFVAFLVLVRNFSHMALVSHKLSVDLQNEVEKMMAEKNRPACLEELEPMSLKKSLGKTAFGNHFVSKKIVFGIQPICQPQADEEN